MVPIAARRPAGIVAAGTFLGGPYVGPHWNGEPGKVTYYADALFETILGPDEVLPLDVLMVRVPGFQWFRLQQSGNRVRGDAEAELHRLWREHLATPGVQHHWVSSEESEAATYSEGDRTTVTVSRIERDPAVRRACLDYYGTSCSVCGMDFKTYYGAFGAGYIHVHHLVPLSASGPTEVDPIEDLRPVCPNCHAMLHAGGLKSIDTLKLAIAESGSN